MARRSTVRRRSFLASSAASLAAPVLVRAAWSAPQPFVFKLHHAFSSVSCVHTGFIAPWARAVETQSNGRIRIDIFPSMQLGGQPEQLFDQARDRIADIVWTMPSRTPGRFPRIEVFELPFLPSRRALVASKAIQDFAAENLKDEFREVHPICFSCADRGVLHARRPIETIAGLKGLRIDVRTRFAGQALELLGAHSQTMPSAQLPMAVARRVVDGSLIPWDMVPSLRLDDVFKAHTDFAEQALSTTTFVLAMNKASYEQLPPDLKNLIDANSGQPAATMAGTMWDLQASAVAATVGQRGDAMVTLAPDEVARWRKATEPVVGGWLKEMKDRKIDGGKLIAGATSLLATYASVPEPQPPAPPKPPPPAADTKAATNNPADGGASGSAHPPPATTPVSRPAPKVASAAQPSHWWEFWKPAQAPATAMAPAPPTTKLGVAATPEPKTMAAVPAPSSSRWWQFWKSTAVPAPATAAPAHTPVVSVTASPSPAAAAVATAPPAAPPAPAAAAAVTAPPPVPPAAPPLPPRTLDIPL